MTNLWSLSRSFYYEEDLHSKGPAHSTDPQVRGIDIVMPTDGMITLLQLIGLASPEYVFGVLLNTSIENCKTK
jgi:hypothetical protein